MKNIVILASGPPKPNRERHTEINKNNGKIIIDDIIDKCTIENTKLYIVINSKVHKLINHVKMNHKNIEILHPEDEKIHSTLKTALSIEGDCVLVCGDLINLHYGDINKFVDTEYSSAICRYKIPWGKNLIGRKYIKRSDIGECITMISEKDKKEFLDIENYNKAITYFNDFYPNKRMNEYIYNDYGTFINYAFFFDIVSNINLNNINNIGSILYNHKIYEDND